MVHALILHTSVGPMLIAVYPSKKRAEDGRRWQTVGGVSSDFLTLAYPGNQRGVFIDTETLEPVTPHNGGFTAEAFESTLDRIWEAAQ